jgi:hypothetical protein
MRSVTSADIRFFRTLTTIRRLGRSGPEHILNAPATRPILDVALRTTFVLLAHDPPRELVIGTVVIKPPAAPEIRSRDAFLASAMPGFARAAMNFHLQRVNDRNTRLTTETRVHATDARSKRRFVVYWRLIYPGSALIRREWLRAIARRAEGRG